MYQFIFKAPAMLEAVEAAKSVAPKNVPILLSGETGTGKEVLAHIVHDASQRSGKFVPVNCAAIPKELVESELFGSVRGAFTGATQDRDGLVAQAHKGTLFLDELSELPNAMQAKLLRVLQDKKVRPVGRNTETEVDFRLIVAMNVDPHILIDRRKLRLDLFYRVNVVNIHLPPLRERVPDILPLATMFLRHYAQENNLEATPTLNEAVQAKLKEHPWPGNVRQLQNEMMRLSALHQGEINMEQLSAELMRNGNGNGQVIVDGSLASHEKAAIQQMLVKCAGNKHMAASMLGIGRQTLYTKIKSYDLQGWVKDMPSRRRQAPPLELKQAVQPQIAEQPAAETTEATGFNLL